MKNESRFSIIDVMEKRFRCLRRCDVCGHPVTGTSICCNDERIKLTNEEYDANPITIGSTLDEVREESLWKQKYRAFKNGKHDIQISLEDFIEIRSSPCACGSSEGIIFGRIDKDKPFKKNNYIGVCANCRKSVGSNQKKIMQYRKTIQYYKNEAKKYEKKVLELQKSLPLSKGQFEKSEG